MGNTHIGGGAEPPGVVGDISDSGEGTSDLVDNGGVPGQPENSNPGQVLQPIEGELDSAPLGTNPKYNVQEPEDLIITRPIGGTSSVGKGVSSESMLWVAVTQHGEEPIPGNVSPPFYEGDKVDLYMRYVVNPGELTIERTWFIEACGLNFTDTYTHPESGIYEAVFPFILPYGSAALKAVFIGAVGLPKVASVFALVGYEGTASVEFEIEYVELLAPVYLPTEFPLDNGGPHACMPDWGSLLVYTDLHVESTDKDLGNVVYVFDNTPGDLNGDEVAVKFDGLSGFYLDPYLNNGEHYVGPFPPVDPEDPMGGQFEEGDCSIVFVHAGCNSSGYGPGYGWRFDAPFTGSGDSDSNQIPTAQIVVEETKPPVDLGDPNVPDYDYNDFAGQFRAVEFYKDPPGDSNNSGLLVQINLTVYAQACSVESPNQWQLNVDCDMPLGTEVQAMVQLFNNNIAKGPSQQWLYYSDSGFSIPLFKPLDKALVYPTTADGPYASVNCDPWNYSQFVEGDYAEITITLSEPAGTGGYDPWPYVPVMWIGLPGVGAYSIGFWKEKGDELNTDGMPQAMLLPDTFAWPLESFNKEQEVHEGIPIWEVYDSFGTWIDWLNNKVEYEPLYPWYDDDPYIGEDSSNPTTWEAFSRDKFTPPE